MRYRVKFTFWHIPNGYYFTEWFDSLEEAETFVSEANHRETLVIRHVEDENFEVVT